MYLFLFAIFYKKLRSCRHKTVTVVIEYLVLKHTKKLVHGHKKKQHPSIVGLTGRGAAFICSLSVIALVTI